MKIRNEDVKISLNPSLERGTFSIFAKFLRSLVLSPEFIEGSKGRKVASLYQDKEAIKEYIIYPSIRMKNEEPFFSKTIVILNETSSKIQ